MRSTKHLTREQIRKLLFAPLSKEAAECMRKADESDRWLLALNFQEMERQESDPNYDPANDPTCVPVTIENDE